jgi:UDP-2,4-diacetamido-2,4,6-trideoxy-beta-L-altropyranose hydrolase
MNVIIRVDASNSIGTGHIMRCLTLADELTQNRGKVEFICREEPGNMINHIEKRGYEVKPLPAGIDLETDRELSQDFLGKHTETIDWLVVDHYELDARWESYMHSSVRKIMVIDDMANRPHDCDLLLDQNYNETPNRYQRLVPITCTQLLGPEYALLRPQFSKAREKLRNRTGEVKRILVFMGGADPTNQTCKVLRAIKKFNSPDIAVDTVIGVSNKHREEIENLASNMSKTICHYNVENMSELMAVADLSIGASGTTSWERCCVGLPSLVITIANNQIKIAENLGKNGIITNLGWFEDVNQSDIKSALEYLLDKPDIIRQMSIDGMRIVDTLGTERVARELTYVK